jgi:SAM-dependent methyltransferase
MFPTNITNLLKCINCNQSSWLISENFLECKVCRQQYNFENNLPILYKTETTPTDLLYPTPESFQNPNSRFRKMLVALHIEGIIRGIVRFYVSINTRLTSFSPAFPEFWMQKISQFLPSSPKVILDFGGGEGVYKKFLASDSDTYIILEIDQNSTSVKKNVNKHCYVIGDGHCDLFNADTFDAITMFEVLEHVHDPFTIFENVARWLKPGGKLILSVPQYWHVHGWPNDYFRYTVHGLRHLSIKNGLQVVDAWAMGGPCVMIWYAIELNFAAILKFPIIRQFIAFPAMLFARLVDAVVFRNNLGRKNPDTRGWVFVAQKPK